MYRLAHYVNMSSLYICKDCISYLRIQNINVTTLLMPLPITLLAFDPAIIDRLALPAYSRVLLVANITRLSMKPSTLTDFLAPFRTVCIVHFGAVIVVTGKMFGDIEGLSGHDTKEVVVRIIATKGLTTYDACNVENLAVMTAAIFKPNSTGYFVIC